MAYFGTSLAVVCGENTPTIPTSTNMTPQQDSTQSALLIVGAGCFGLATAHSLASAGHTNITVLDKDDEVPSRFSAANDLNKVIRAEYTDTFYTDLSVVSSCGQFPFTPCLHFVLI